MKKTIILLIFIVILLTTGYYSKQRYYEPKQRIKNARNEVKWLINNNKIKDADLIFQTSLSKQSIAIQKASKSIYSHCGLIFKDSNDFYVYEAVQPVKRTPLDKWIAKGKDGHYVIKRLKDSNHILNDEITLKIKKNCQQFMGKNYDITFEWSDEKIYCSELIWKAYQRACGIEIGQLQKLKAFDLTDETVKAKMKERYGNNIPMNEIVISPAAIFESKLLIIVKSN
ncbi:MAG: YiiX family permuted papain-like enzyme [Bacteroidetes bacterium]|nr:YiiX family permuted papain-like enzyme [Bacteroidota bacterium]